MKAARFYKAGEKLRIEDVETPKIGSGDVLIKVKACGICHTDRHFLDGELEYYLQFAKLPMILGHEVAGDIAKVGKSVSKFKEGDRVLFYYGPTGAGFTADGGFAEYVKAPESCVVSLPKGITHENGAPLTCAGGTAYHAVMRAGVKLGDAVVIDGFGGLGIYCLQIARLSGATKIIVVDVEQKKLGLAKELGADHVINAKDRDVVKEVMKVSDGQGVDVVFEFVAVPKTMDNAMKSLKKDGKLMSIGVGKGVNFEVDPRYILRNELSIIGCCGHTKEELVNLTKLVAAGKVTSTITQRFPLTKINEALDQLKRGEILGRSVLSF